METIKASNVCFDTTSKRSKDSVKYIVMHYTSNNGDTASGNGNYFKIGGTFEKNVNSGKNSKAGAHFFIDQKGNIVNSVDISRTAWSVGGGLYSDISKTGGGKYYKAITNANSVSIELCDIALKDPSTSMIDAVKKCIKYIRKHCKNADTVVRHFDITGKHCPAPMMKDEVWKKFLDKIGESKSYIAPKVDPVTKEFKVQVIVPSLMIRKVGKSNAMITGEVRIGEVYTITETKDGWGKLKSGAGWINVNTKYVRMV